MYDTTALVPFECVTAWSDLIAVMVKPLAVTLSEKHSKKIGDCMCSPELSIWEQHS